MKYALKIKYVTQGTEEEKRYKGLTKTEVQQVIKSMFMTYDVTIIEVMVI